MALDSRDPELPATMGVFLYRIGLPEYADRYRDRSNLLAPNSPSGRYVTLEGLLARGDRDASDRLARSMVADDIDERHGSYFMAVYTVLQNAIARENAAEGLGFVTKYQPGFNDPTSSELSFKVRNAQFGAFPAWHSVFGLEKASEMADECWRVFIESGNLKSDFPASYMEILALRGETEAAIDFALAEVVDKTITDTIWYRELFDAPHLAAVVADPRIQARFRQWDEDLLTVRAEVKVYLDGIQ